MSVTHATHGPGCFALKIQLHLHANFCEHDGEITQAVRDGGRCQIVGVCIMVRNVGRGRLLGY